jgi:AcrR family transcriptional regulator
MPDSSAARKTNLSRKPKQARSHQSLAKMLDTAKQMLAEQGYAEFTLQELSKRSNVSIGSIYHRFENKQELVRQVQAEVLEAIESKYAVLINHLRRQALPLQELMPSVVTLFGNHLKQHAPILRVFMEVAPTDPVIAEIGRKYLRQAMLDFKLLLLDRRDEIHHRDAVTR